jgi:hypothetical protein
MKFLFREIKDRRICGPIVRTARMSQLRSPPPRRHHFYLPLLPLDLFIPLFRLLPEIPQILRRLNHHNCLLFSFPLQLVVPFLLIQSLCYPSMIFHFSLYHQMLGSSHVSLSLTCFRVVTTIVHTTPCRVLLTSSKPLLYQTY